MTAEPLNTHADARGYVVEPLRPDEFAFQRNSHLVVSRPGGIRGNHYHRRGTEIMAVVGPARVYLRGQGEAIETTDVPGGAVYRFTFPPGLSHAVQNTSDEDNILVAFNTEVHDPDAPDVVRDVLVE